jgi:hypothetical protein
MSDTFAEYAAITSINWSLLKELKRSPLHFQHRRSVARDDSPLFAKGRAYHTATLEPHRFDAEYAIFEGARRAGKEWDAFEAENASKTILRRPEADACLLMAERTRNHLVAAGYLAAGIAEQSIQWIDDKTGIKCKARPDWVCDSIVELKSTRDAGQSAFGRTAANLSYHGQLAFYRRGIRATTGRDLPMVVIVCEAEPPHDVAVYRVGAAIADQADALIDGLLAQLKLCMDTNRWPGAHEDEQDLLFPRWAMDESDEDELTSEVIGGGV